MSKNKLGQDSPFSKFLHLKIRRLNGVESLTTLEEGEFKFAIDGCIRLVWTMEFFMFTIFEISWFLIARGSVLQV